MDLSRQALNGALNGGGNIALYFYLTHGPGLALMHSTTKYIPSSMHSVSSTIILCCVECQHLVKGLYVIRRTGVPLLSMILSGIVAIQYTSESERDAIPETTPWTRVALFEEVTPFSKMVYPPPP